MNWVLIAVEIVPHVPHTLSRDTHKRDHS
jgi:hypothetical protein